MTDNYRSELFSRIRKLNFTNAHFFGQAFRLFLLFSAFFSLFYLLGSLTAIGENAKKIAVDFFCIGFKNSGPFAFLLQALSFSCSDFYLSLIIFISGYTMLSFPVSALCLAYAGAKSGYCFSCLWQILIRSGDLSGGGATFAYLAVCKLCVTAAMIFICVCARDFSYRYSDIYRKVSRPLTSPESVNYATVAVSAAGLTVLINLLFLTFQYISPSTYI